VPKYPLFIITGILPWMFFAQSVCDGMESLLENRELLTKVPIPLQIFPLVSTVTHFINFLLSVPVIVGAALLYESPITLNYLLLPYFLLVLFFASHAISLVLGICLVFLNDVRHMMTVGIQLWMYATPILYQPDMIPEKFRFLLYCNPLTFIFVGIQDIVVFSRTPAAVTIVVPLIWCFLLVCISLFVYNRTHKTLVERL